MAWVDFHLSPVSLFKIAVVAIHGLKNLGLTKVSDNADEPAPEVTANDPWDDVDDTNAPLTDAEAILWVAIKFANGPKKMKLYSIWTFLNQVESWTENEIMLLRVPSELWPLPSMNPLVRPSWLYSRRISSSLEALDLVKVNGSDGRGLRTDTVLDKANARWTDGSSSYSLRLFGYCIFSPPNPSCVWSASYAQLSLTAQNIQ